jgi:hypothetical protein
VRVNKTNKTTSFLNLERSLLNVFHPYNPCMADRIACSCVTCPKCGAWIVVRAAQITAVHGEDALFQASCAIPECGNEFSFKREDARAFELPLALFERRYFYRSELLTSS